MSRSSTDLEASATLAQKSKGGFFSRQRSVKTANEVNNEKNTEVITSKVKAAEPELPPVSFSSLFRYVEKNRLVQGMA